MEGDAIEWIAEALDFMCVTPRLIDKKRILTVENYSTRIPIDLSQLELCYYNPTATSETEEHEFNLILKNESNSYSRTLHQKLLNNVEDFNGINEFYKLEQGYIKTSFSTGYIFILYKGYPIDSEGFPIVPDHTVVKEAITWYLQLKLALTGWKHPAGLDYFQIDGQWQRYCSQARVKIKLPDSEEYRKLHETWVRLIPSDETNGAYNDPNEFNDVQDYVDSIKAITPQ